MKKYYLYKFDLFKLNVFSIILFFVMYLISLIFFDYNLFFDLIFEKTNWFLLLLCYLIYVLLHEMVHALSYVINGASFKKITFGMMLEKGILYCLCKQNISKKNILISSIMPLVILGFIVYIIGAIYNSKFLMLLSMLNISGCAGDIITFMFISKLKNVEFSEMDDPTYFAIYSSKDISKKKYFGLKYIGKKDSIKRDDLRKVVVSAFSIFLLLFLIIISFN